VLLLWATLLLPAFAGNFVVAPVNLELGSAARSSAVTVNNLDGQPLRLQVRLVAWDQDAQGESRHTPSDDLLYFPRLLTIPPGESRMVRVGLARPVEAVERSYRLFLDELDTPGGDEAATGKSQVLVRVSFGIPLFVSPPRAQARVGMEVLPPAQGLLRWRLVNEGTRHARLESFTLVALTPQGEPRGSQTVDLRYLLAGKTLEMALEAPPVACEPGMRIEAQLRIAEAGVVRQAWRADQLPCP
jgi:fimbrial chaperone protein